MRAYCCLGERMICPPGFSKGTSLSWGSDAWSTRIFQWYIIITVHRRSVCRDVAAHHHLGTWMVGLPGVSQAHCCLGAWRRSPKGIFKRTVLSQSAKINLAMMATATMTGPSRLLTAAAATWTPVRLFPTMGPYKGCFVLGMMHRRGASLCQIPQQGRFNKGPARE
jgi:hypothetical protein